MKYIIKTLLLLFVAVLFATCKEEEYTTKSTIYGTIIEATDNTPIEGAVVTNQTTGKNCITAKDGKYEFQNLNFGEEYDIYVEKEGYIPSHKKVTPSEVRDKIEMNIKLEKRP